MPVKHHFQSGRADNGDAGAVQPSHWVAAHDLSGMLAVLDQLAPTPNVVFTLDGSGNLSLQATASFAPSFSPNFTGVPTAPTALQTVNSTQIATTEYVHTAVTNLIGGAPGALVTLQELAAAINNDNSYASTVTAALGVRLRVDAAQGLTGAQKAQGVANLGLATVAVSGNYADLAGRPTLGTAAALNVGTAANQIIQLDGNAKLPAVDGSQLTGIAIPAGALRYDVPQAPTAAQQGIAQYNAASMPFTGQIVESHAGGAVTFAVKTFAGNDPDPNNPVLFRFPNGGGKYVYIAVIAALSVTIPAGANLGQSTSAQAFRVWIAAFNDAGTIRLAVRTCFSGGSAISIVSPAENRPASSTLTPANAAHTFYTTGAAVASKYWAWIAHAVYESGLAAAGTWAVSPDYITLVDAASRRPGERVSGVYATGGSTSVTGTAYVDTNTTATITPLSAANAARFRWSGSVLSQQGANGFIISVHCDASPTIYGGVQLAGNMSVNTFAQPSGGGMRAPLNTTAPTTFKVQIKDDTAGQSCTFGYNGSVPEIEVEEIMT